MPDNNSYFKQNISGILRCSRYAFGPNKLHYCGPDKNEEILAYLENNRQDFGLKGLLQEFKTMYPYLCHIARENKIKDPFDDRVVEAYWLGNELLETIEKKQFYRHLKEGLDLEKKLNHKLFNQVTEKIRRGALPHHSFHVLDIWKRTGNLETEHTLESLDNCRISWGQVQKVEGPFVTLKTKPLIIRNGKLGLGEPIFKKLTRHLESSGLEQLKPNDIVSFHWNALCEVITKKQAVALEKYTLLHLNLANQTI